MVKTLQKIISYSATVAEPEKIILFGSMASNNSNVFSDVDLLIISDSIINKKGIVDMIVCYTKEYSLKTDVLIRTSAEIEKELLVPNSFLGWILKSGKVVWSRKN
jgi:predicted nucleotidyltransferase